MPDRPDEAKAALRRELRRRLAALGRPAREQAADTLAQRVLALPAIEAATDVFTCLSFGVEIDTWRIARGLLDAGKRVYVPRADFATRALHLHRYPCELVELGMGLRQPAPGAPQLAADDIDSTVDVALIAGLAFDRDGYRLGHGGGFFDRFLVDRPFAALGLAYHLQIVEALPREPHDRPMSAVATELELIEP